MPFIFVANYTNQAPIANTATQKVTSETLDITGPTVLELDPTVFTVAGRYIIFDYTGTTFPGGQTALDSYVTVSLTDTPAFSIYTLTDDPANSRVILSLA